MYKELDALLPELAALLDALQELDADSPTNLAPRLQSGFLKAQELNARLQKQWSP